MPLFSAWMPLAAIGGTPLSVTLAPSPRRARIAPRRPAGCSPRGNDGEIFRAFDMLPSPATAGGNQYPRGHKAINYLALTPAGERR
jgi:hypothetical protein